MARKTSFRKNPLVTAVASLLVYSSLSVLLEHYILNTDEALALLFAQNVIITVRGNGDAGHRHSSAWFPQQQQQHTPAYQHGLGACLTFEHDTERDGTTVDQLLTEWLAYHYTILPLRSLIVSIDGSQTRSSTRTNNLTQILGQWQRDTDLDVLVWEDEDFLDGHEILRRQKRENDGLQSNGMFDRVRNELQQEKQDSFLSHCFLHHSLRGTRWVAASLDIADFVVPGEMSLEKHISLLENETVRMSLRAPSSASEWEQSCLTFPVEPVYPMERVVDVDESTGVPKLVNGLNLRTRSRYFSPPQPDTVKRVEADSASWMVMDVSRMGLEEASANATLGIYQRFLSRSCGHASSDHENGTIHALKLLPISEQMEVQDDDRRRRGVHLDSWINQFVEKVGFQTGRRLLGPPMGTSNEVPGGSDSQPCALLFFGLARGFADISYPSIKQHILEANPQCDIYVHTYNVTKAKGGDRGEQIKSEDGQGKVQPEEVLLLFDKDGGSSNVLFETEQEFRAQRDFKSYRGYFPYPSSWDYPHSMDNMIRQWHSIDQVWRLMARHERTRLHRRYRRVGLFRLDMVYTHSIEIVPEGDDGEELAVIPSIMYQQSNWFGYNDRMFYGTRAFAEIWATDRFGSVDDYMHWQKRHTDTKKKDGLHSEDFLRFLLTQKWRIPLTIKDFCFQRVRSNGVVLTNDCLYLDYVQMLQEVNASIDGEFEEEELEKAGFPEVGLALEPRWPTNTS
mmetsp:Transcript_5717/g.8080  ORF Transcript_5717/g.8080 Transcript_5717/m.8080 type:complete len:736 (-) Transcript_5717:371-2578(-)|eukprot:CAMPEP_0194034700 /NCGR_PEP_ID=MMETSP0009_2-20130614/7115_1 /TAXON_ID=210454 /ORGANISM="Grammatophora oceanica, Strain CCMP 410" /LENGTH=735 /DNA_ID=CAMNT_0038675731 /DNA_START=59 /DNA_END=2266 /DNA_ORIENTATION=+